MTLQLSDEEYSLYRDLICQRAGLYFDEAKRTILAQHLGERLAASHTPSLADYYALLTDGAAHRREHEWQELTDLLTINETSFFRNQEHFATLREIVLPDLFRQRGGNISPPPAGGSGAGKERLRLWSAGCATGEEAYSLAITLLEATAGEGWQFEIIAGDIDHHALKHAEAARYGRRSLREVSANLISRYFIPLDDKPEPERYHVRDEIRQLVRFSPFNLAAFPYDTYKFGKQDVIFCENVLIYFHPDGVQQVIDNLYRCLRPGGYLFLGYAETLWQVPNRFELVSLPNTFCYRRPLEEHPTSTGFASHDQPRPVAHAGTGPLRLPIQPLLMNQMTTGPLNLPLPTTDELLHLPQIRGMAAPEQGDRPPAEWVAFGDKLRNSGRYADALLAYQAALRSNPQAVEAICGVARIHALRNLHDLAIAECLRAIAVDTLCEDAHLIMGGIYAAQSGEIARVKAVEAYQKAVYINLESQTAHFRLAEIYRDATRRGTRRERENARAAALREYRTALRCLTNIPDEQQIDGLPAAAVRRLCELNISALA